MRALIVALALCIANVAFAQGPSRIEIESALTKVMVAEVGWKHERDHDAMLFAIHRLDVHELRSHNLLETLGYHIPWWHLGYPPKRPWIAGLNTSCEKPEGFPSNWDAHRRLCFRVVGKVRDYYAGRLTDPCRGAPNNWRARGRVSRKAKRLYYHVGCGRTRHNFFNTHRDPRGRITKRSKHEYQKPTRRPTKPIHKRRRRGRT